MADVFISYSSKESQWATKLRDLLAQAGVEVWMAPDSIPVGSNYPNEIDLAITGSRSLVLAFNSHSDASVWVHKEVCTAISSNVDVIPLRTDDVNLAGAMRTYLIDVHIRDVKSPEEAAAEVLRALGSAGFDDEGTPSDPVSCYLGLESHQPAEEAVFIPHSPLPDAVERRGMLGRSLIGAAMASPTRPGPLSPEVLVTRGGRFLVVGEAGSGKTTFLRDLFRKTCSAANNDQTAALPLLVDAPSLAGIELSELCARTLSRAAGTELDLAAAEALVAERGVTLFVDGLDECRGADARAAMLGALDALATSPAVRAVVATSRPSEEIAPAGFTTLRLAPFSRQEQIDFLDRYADAQGIGWSGESLLDALPAGLRELAGRPLFLALIVTAVAYRGDLPETTDELFDDYLNVLLGGYATEEALMVERVLCELAFWCVRESRVTVPLKKIGEVCERMTDDMEATELLRRSVLESGVLVPAHGGASFAHLTLMDHLARNYAASIYNFEPSHSMVQYFLRDPDKIDLMVSSGCVMPTDRVAEFGAGIGSVARHIPQAKSLTLVELDERLATILRNDFSERQEVTVHQGDAIAWLAGHDVDVIFSNLPFFLTDELLDVLAEKEFRVAVVAMPPDHSLDDWEDRLRFTYVETNEGGDYFPPQPVASNVMKVTPRRR